MVLSYYIAGRKLKKSLIFEKLKKGVEVLGKKRQKKTPIFIQNKGRGWDQW